MKQSIRITTALGVLGIAALFHAPVASADRVGFNISFGGPGYTINVGNRGLAVGYLPPPVVYGAPIAYPAPVIVSAPVVIPAPVVVAPPYVVPSRSGYRSHPGHRRHYSSVVAPHPKPIAPYPRHRDTYRHR